MTAPQSRSRRASWRRRAPSLVLWLALVACGGVSGKTAGRPAPEQPAQSAQRRTPPQRPDPDRFRLGLPQDDTAFDYDVADHHDDPAPTLDGIPPVTRAVARALQPYLEVRRARLVGVSPGAKRMLVLTRTSETTQVHEVDGPLGMRRQVTFGAEPVEQVAYLPGGTRALSYRRDAGGDENHQIFLLDLESRGTRRLSDGKSRHGPFRWSSTGQLAFTSTARSGRDTALHSYDLRSGESQVVAELSGRWVVLGWSSDAKRLLMQESRFADESTVHVVEVDTGEMTAIAPLVANTSIRRAWFAKRPGFVYVLSDRDRDFAGVFEVDLATLQWRLITPDRPWDVEEAATSSDGRRLVFSLNEHGYSKVYLKDLMTGRQRRLALPEGVVSGLRFVDRDRKLAFTATTPTEPEDVYLFDLGTGALRRWTESELGGLPRGGFVVPELVQARSFDGLEIPALLYRPPGDGPFPVLFWMHGGPEGQARPAFDPIIQYFASARGIAVLAPNVRGSSGYGKRFMGLDDGLRRHDAVADVGALLDYVDGREDLDSSRVGIHGASYGGFMVLASLVAYPKRFVAGSDVVGMSDLVSFLESTGAYRRGVRRGEYGDERDPKVREYLASISPLTHVKRIRSALLVAHGENDPRVALSEAEQIVSAVRKNGAEAWFFVGRSEGHSFRRRRTRDTFYRVMAEFFERHLLQRTALGLETEKP
jgi:dipeptidyl aminopeptidase/acylaminoacyl peptidase